MHRIIAAFLAAGLIIPGAGAAEDAPLYLVKEGHLPTKHWWHFKRGKHYWLVKMKGGEEVIYYDAEIVKDVPDLRPWKERNRVMQFIHDRDTILIPFCIVAWFLFKRVRAAAG